MHVAGNQVYFWNQQADRFELHFDYAAAENYFAQWSGVCHSEDGVATANIDSLTEISVSGDLLDVQHLSIADNGSFVHDMPAKVYVGIGNDESLKLQLGYGLCDPNSRTTKLRCFANGEVAYNFVDYPCDTTFIISAVAEVFSSELRIYPNPSTGNITIDGAAFSDVLFSIYDSTGKLLKSGTLQTNSLFIEEPGVYFLSLQKEDMLWQQKVVILRE
jgi:hypothetical protein